MMRLWLPLSSQSVQPQPSIKDSSLRNKSIPEVAPGPRQIIGASISTHDSLNPKEEMTWTACFHGTAIVKVPVIKDKKW